MFERASRLEIEVENIEEKDEDDMLFEVAKDETDIKKSMFETTHAINDALAERLSDMT